MNVLGLETSCDETGVAVFHSERGLVGQALHSQIDLHRVYGGVVPEIAARDHIRRLLPLIKSVLEDAGVGRPDAGVEILVLFYTNTWHTNTFFGSDTKKPGTKAGT